MIDLKFLRENPEVVKQNIKNKFQDHKLPLVDEVIELDAKARAVQQEADDLRASRNKLSKQIGQLMGQGKKDEAEAVKAQKKAFDIDLRTLWQYRDLYVMYVKRDIITVYKQTILGPLWFLIQPVLTTIMFTFVFGGLAGITTNGIPQPLFYMSGIVLWNYFSTAFTDTSDVFGKNAFFCGFILIVQFSSLITYVRITP